MNMKLKEAQEREQNIEKMHNTMMKAFKNDDKAEKESSFAKEYEYITIQHQKEMNDTVKSFEFQINHLSKIK